MRRSVKPWQRCQLVMFSSSVEAIFRARLRQPLFPTCEAISELLLRGDLNHKSDASNDGY